MSSSCLLRVQIHFTCRSTLPADFLRMQIPFATDPFAYRSLCLLSRVEEEEEEEGLYLRIETRKRVQTNEAKSKRRRASPT